jgi:hypothetical protein
VKLSDVIADLEANAIASQFDNGYLRIYDGSQPATPEDAVTTQHLLAELRFGATAFGASSSGVLTATAITKESSAPYAASATWFRALKSNGTTALLDGTVSTSGADLNLSSVGIAVGVEVSVTTFTHTVRKW